MHVDIGDKVYVSDMSGIFEIISISYINYHKLDLILQNKDGVKYAVKRRRYQLTKTTEYSDIPEWLKYD